jgi:hypothetical protein
MLKAFAANEWYEIARYNGKITEIMQNCNQGGEKAWLLCTFVHILVCLARLSRLLTMVFS